MSGSTLQVGHTKKQIRISSMKGRFVIIGVIVGFFALMLIASLSGDAGSNDAETIGEQLHPEGNPIVHTYGSSAVGYSYEEIQDNIATFLTSGSKSGISVVYDDATGNIDFVIADPTQLDLTGPGSWAGSYKPVIAGTDVTYGELVVRSATNAQVWPADLDELKYTKGSLGIMCADVAATASGTMMTRGTFTYAGWNFGAGDELWVGTVPGVITSIAASGSDQYVRPVGSADDTDTITFGPDYIYIGLN